MNLATAITILEIKAAYMDLFDRAMNIQNGFIVDKMPFISTKYMPLARIKQRRVEPTSTTLPALRSCLGMKFWDTIMHGKVDKKKLLPKAGLPF